MKKLFVAWQDSKSRQWATVAQLTHEKGSYAFEYTKGATQFSDFRPFGKMDNLKKKYVSDRLFPIFSNRILAKGRPEYLEYLTWLGMSSGDYSDMDELALTGGLRATDDLEIFPCPQPTSEGRYQVIFFCRGLQHLHTENVHRSASLKQGEKLFLMQDLQNKKHRAALLLRSDDPITLMGYTPRYFSADFSGVLKQQGPDAVSITVDKVNIDAPLQYRVRCKLESDWPAGFSACSDEMYMSLAKGSEHSTTL